MTHRTHIDGALPKTYERGGIQSDIWERGRVQCDTLSFIQVEKLHVTHCGGKAPP
jgi:hypothetical protein